MHLTGKDKHRFEMKGWGKIFQAHRAWKQTGVAIFISDKADFKPKLVRKDKRRLLHIDKGDNLSGRCNNCKYIRTEYWPNVIKQTLAKLFVHKSTNGLPNTKIVSDFNMQVIWDKRIKGKLQNWKTQKDQMELTDIYRIFHPTAVEFTFFSEVHGTFSQIHHSLRHKTSHNK
jgi:hypothetical protein